MHRVEIIANRSMEEDLLETLHAQEVAMHYSLLYGVRGVGESGARLGSSVWPEENCILIIYCDVQEARRIQQAVHAFRQRNPQEGVAFFCVPSLPATQRKALRTRTSKKSGSKD